MKTLPWIVAGVGAGMATYMMLRQQRTPQLATAAGTGYGAVDDAANRTDAWGDQQRVAGAGTNVVGKVKEGLGRLTGNDQLASEGAADQVAGTVRNAAGGVGNAAGQTLRDLNF
jgi:uncharacterized protein YjbJ (UPF0337 family)